MLTFGLSKTLTAVVIAGLLGLAPLSGWAQSNSESETTEEGETSNVEGDLSLGEDASTPQIGQAYIGDQFGDWDMRCLRTEDPENDPCQMYQLVNDDTGAPVAEVSIFRLPGDGRAKAGATIVVPLETALQQQLTIQIDSGAAKRYPFAFCNSLGCFARVGFTEEDLNAYRRGAIASIVIVAIANPDQKIALPLSLTGFTKGFEAASIVQQ